MAKTRKKRKKNITKNEQTSGRYKNFKPGEYVMLPEQLEYMDAGFYQFDGVFDEVAYLSIGQVLMSCDVSVVDKCWKYTQSITKAQLQQRMKEHLAYFDSWCRNYTGPSIRGGNPEKWLSEESLAQ